MDDLRRENIGCGFPCTLMIRVEKAARYTYYRRVFIRFATSITSLSFPIYRDIVNVRQGRTLVAMATAAAEWNSGLRRVS